MIRIRTLSSPEISEIDDAAAYVTRLRSNFREIGVLSAQNREIIDTYLKPLLYSDEPLTDGQVGELHALFEMIWDAVNVENLDNYMAAVLTRRLLKDAMQKGDLAYRIREWDETVSASYSLVNMNIRVISNPSIPDRYRKDGMDAAEHIFAYLPKDRFAQLDDESKELALIDSRYAAALYETLLPIPHGEQERMLQLLKRTLEIYNDPFYHQQVPGYDWRYHLFRTLQYFSSNSAFGNIMGLDEAAILDIDRLCRDMDKLWASDPAYYRKLDSEGSADFFAIRARYNAGKMEKSEYQRRMLELYRLSDKTLYDTSALYTNVSIPVEYMLTLDRENLSDQEKKVLKDLYRQIVRYAFHMPNSGTLTGLLEFYAIFLESFIEFEGGPTFEEIVLQCMAAFHPPTYIHSMMVGELTSCFARHLLEKDPDRLRGLGGFSGAGAPEHERQALQDFVYHAAICHDVGKLNIFDTIFVYGRNLIDEEWQVLREHPDIGAILLGRQASTRAYADVARGHHRWYDNTAGYPPAFDTAASALRSLIDIVSVSDSIDAATDLVGRSFHKGKTLDQVIEEIREGSGTRYAPFMAALLSDPAVRDEVGHIITEGRELQYRRTFEILRKVDAGPVGTGENNERNT